MTAHKPKKTHPWARWQPAQPCKPYKERLDERVPDDANPLSKRQARRARHNPRSPKA